MKRKVLGLTLSAALVLSGLPVAGIPAAGGGDWKASAAQEGGVPASDEGDAVTASGTFGGEKDSTGAEITPDTHKWSFAAGTGTLTISGEGAIPDYTSSTYAGLPWYGNKDDIKKIVFTGNVTKVGGYMFYNYNQVEEVDFGAAEELAEIGDHSFYGTTLLETLTGTEKLTTLGVNCFKSSGLKAVNMPSVEAVPEGAFNGCSSLAAIHFQGATVLGKQAFQNCKALKEVDAPNVGSLGESAFNTCNVLEAINLPELTTITGGSAFYGCAKIQTISFPKLMSISANNTFMNCTSLETIDLPAMTELGNAASFARGCTSLTSVNIPNVELKDASQIFDGCSALVYVDISSVKNLNNTTIFKSCDSLKRIYMKGTKLTSKIGASFYNAITSKPVIYHLSAATNMGTYANLQVVDSEDDFAAIKGKETTLHLSQENYDIDSPIEPKVTGNAQGASVTYAYYTDVACRNPVDANNPSAKPTVAGDYFVRATATATDSAFETTSNPAAFRVYGEIPGTGYTYHNGTHTLTITEASAVESDYAANSAPWYKPYRLELEKVVVKEGVNPTRIGDYAFSNLRWMTSFSLPDTVTSIGASAFSGCWVWEAENVLTTKVTSVGKSAFNGCRKLTGTMALNENITEIPDMLFYECWSVTKIEYAADKITSFGSRCFYGSGVSELALPKDITTIPDYFYAGCKNVTSVTIPASVTTLGEYCFNACESLKEITIPDGVTTIGSRCFYGSGITSITLPEGCVNIGDGVFGYTKNLETFEIPASMTVLPASLFYYSGIKKLIIPATVTQINKDALRGLSRLEYLEFEKDDYADDTLVGSTSTDGGQSYDSTFAGAPKTAMILCDGATYDLLASRGTHQAGWLASEILYKRSEVLANLETEYAAVKEEAGKLTAADYDGELWEAFQTVLSESETLFAKGETVYDKITNRTAAINSISAGAKPFLRATYQKTLDILESDYDTDGDGADAWFDYLDQRDLALEVLQKGDATLTEIIQSDKRLRKALGDIVLRPVEGPKAEVEQAIKEAQALKEADYTPESWAALQAAIKEAQEICKDATKISQVEEAKKKVEDAMAALVKASVTDPGAEPSKNPDTPSSAEPSTNPSTKPSTSPSTKPSASPSGAPSTQPTKDPGGQTTKDPSGSQINKTPGGTANTKKVSVKKVTLKKVKSTKKKTITVQWKKVSGVTGYQVQIALNKTFKKGKKTYTVKKAKTVKKTVKRLKRKKKYYVRVRAYKTVKGKKYYGKWSKVKKVKVR